MYLRSCSRKSLFRLYHALGKHSFQDRHMGRTYRIVHGDHTVGELKSGFHEDMLVDTSGIDAQVLEYGSKTPTKAHDCPKKRIIIACDGTWMDSDGVRQVPSNITRIVRAIPPVGIDYTVTPSKPIPQISFYQNGIGTGGSSWYARHIGAYVSGATGEGLSANIREAYNFLCCNYHRGDEIILLGFSRGAFTARSISTLIKQLGLLTPRGLGHLVEICDDWEHQLSEHYKTPYPNSPWKNRPNFASREYYDKLHELKMTRRNIPIKCVGVWDTVGALGMPQISFFPQKHAQEFAFVDTRVEDNIEYAFQALGLDEKRKPYAPTIWFKPRDQKLPRILKQTWFPGVHSDIGGSYSNDDLANITLAWMVGQLEDAQILTFNHDYIIRQVHRTIQRHAEEQERLYQNSSLSRSTTFGPLRQWGLGKIHDSYTLFFHLGGSQTRTPMQHEEISRATREPTGRLLTGTNETMHASVRVRMALGGHGYDDKGSYESDALQGWKYEWEAYAQPDTPFQLTQPGEVGKLKNVEWVKFSSNGDKEILRMPEDKMTAFERVILRHWTAAEADWEEGAEERETMVDSVRPVRRESERMGWDTGLNVSGGRRAKGRSGFARGVNKNLEKSLEVLDEHEEPPVERDSTDREGVGQRRRLSIVTNNVRG